MKSLGLKFLIQWFFRNGVVPGTKQYQIGPNSTKQYRTVLFLENCHFSFFTTVHWKIFNILISKVRCLVRAYVLGNFAKKVRYCLVLFGIVWYCLVLVPTTIRENHCTVILSSFRRTVPSSNFLSKIQNKDYFMVFFQKSIIHFFNYWVPIIIFIKNLIKLIYFIFK